MIDLLDELDKVIKDLKKKAHHEMRLHMLKSGYDRIGPPIVRDFTLKESMELGERYRIIFSVSCEYLNAQDKQKYELTTAITYSLS
jgi:hypothetical protein